MIASVMALSPGATRTEFNGVVGTEEATGRAPAFQGSVALDYRRALGAGEPLVAPALVLDADKAKQIAVLLNGAGNGAMPAWKQLSDTEIAAVITYTKNNWSNKTGQLVQPSEIVAARK